MTDQPDEARAPAAEVAIPGPTSPPEEPSTPAEEPEAPAPAPVHEGKAFDGSPRAIEAPAVFRDLDPADEDDTDTSDASENVEGDDGGTANYRNDFFGTRVDVGGDARYGMFAMRDIHLHGNGGQERQTFKQRVNPDDLARAEARYVRTGTEPEIRKTFAWTRLIFLRIRVGDGGGTTALALLDELTERHREESRVWHLSPADPHVLMTSVEKRAGLLVDTRGTKWATRLGRSEADALVARLRERAAFMIVLVDADASLLATDQVVHIRPDTEQVFRRHLAFLCASRSGGETPVREKVDAAMRDELPRMVKEIEEGSQEARDWYAAIRVPGTPPREGVIFAQECWNWWIQRSATADGEPPPFPRRDLTEEARNLLRRKSGSDSSPVRQAYVIAAAVLDDVSLSEIADQAGQLAEGFNEIERPGTGVRRQVFGEPFRSWLEQLSAGSPSGVDTDPMWRRRRELSRAVVEVAWSDYDVVRLPLRTWLVQLCEQRDGVQRVRAVQALALIAAKDYAQIRSKVLRVWARSQKNRHHECAAWLLEAMMLFGVPALQRAAERELRAFARSPRKAERAIALRAYGTRVTTEERLDAALEAVHGSIGVLGGRFGVLIAQCLRDLYELGHREPVLSSLVRRMRVLPFPQVQEQAAQTIVGIARLPSGRQGHDLLRFVHALPRGTRGADDSLSLRDVAELWWYACHRTNTRTKAWQTLGQWHADCVKQPELMPTFEALLDAMTRVDGPERPADGKPVRIRIGLYREIWKKQAREKEQ